jgi:hypothetical protein
MSRTFAGLLAALGLACLSHALSAPMAPFGPMHLEGTVEEVSWHPREEIKGVSVEVNGKRVPLSGSLGVDRTIRAHYRLVLIDTVVERPESEKANPDYRSYPVGQRATVTVYRDADDGYLRKGMRIRLRGYTEGGDEGGTWSSYDRVEVLSGPAPDFDGRARTEATSRSDPQGRLPGLREAEGRSALLVHAREGGSPGVFVSRPDGTGLRRLSDASTGVVLWEPDGRHLALWRADQGRFVGLGPSGEVGSVRVPGFVNRWSLTV